MKKSGMCKLKKVRIIGIILFLLLFFSFAGYSADLRTISSKLICQCGCNMILATCQCEKAEEMRDQIKTMIGQGKNEEEILEFFVTLYGERILGAPIKKGFNLSAYILPFVVISLGAALVWWVVKKWTRSSQSEKREEEEIEEEYRKKVRQELDKYEF